MGQSALSSQQGSWDTIVQALRQISSLGSSQEGLAASEAANRRSGSEAGNLSCTASLFVSGIAIKEIASKISDTKLRNELNGAADQALADWQDDYCGISPQPNPRAMVAAAELAAFANSVQEGNLRNEALRVAGQIVQKAFSLQTAQTKQRTATAATTR